jgi:uncharacterized protein
MKPFLLIIISCLFIACGSDPEHDEEEITPVQESPVRKRILVFTKTTGHRHNSIPNAKQALTQILANLDIDASFTEDAAIFNADSLKKYKAVVFLLTSGEILNDQQQTAFEQFITAGGGFAGVHSAADTEYEWPFYGSLLGAYFYGHPGVQDARITKLISTHPSTSFLGHEWMRKDEWYNFKNIQPGIKVLLNLDESSYEGGRNGPNHPISWYQDFGNHKSFYTGMGHTIESYSEPDFIKHLQGGVQYVLE